MLQLAAGAYLAASKAPPASTASLTFAATPPGARRSGLIPLAGQRQHAIPTPHHDALCQGSKNLDRHTNCIWAACVGSGA
jgi:hypothetical protein